ncbi:Crp/Fnr family transcriptional regulator [Devosia sp. CN2-171]|jgi:CRP/FNR family transcriptional regulator, cyclic AMP receptor protein|uniref:Crp/Fnr family transcriptional regulator n=1 Tax=Devosia sp. CN2-171 TaxID=3400909 RepID=UPI003BF86CE6
MPGLAALTVALPLETLAPGTQLTTEGTRSGQLYILESGRLKVARGGVTLATISEPGAIIGEMAVLLGIPHSATVTAETTCKVRVLDEAFDALVHYPELALHIATIACARLNTTSALLVQLQSQSTDQPRENALLSRLLGALSAAPRGSRGHWADHE